MFQAQVLSAHVHANSTFKPLTTYVRNSQPIPSLAGSLGALIASNVYVNFDCSRYAPRGESTIARLVLV